MGSNSLIVYVGVSRYRSEDYSSEVETLSDWLTYNRLDNKKYLILVIR